METFQPPDLYLYRDWKITESVRAEWSESLGVKFLHKRQTFKLLLDASPSSSSPCPQVRPVLLSAGIRMWFSVRLGLCLVGFFLVSEFPQPARGQGKYLLRACVPLQGQTGPKLGLTGSKLGQTGPKPGQNGLKWAKTGQTGPKRAKSGLNWVKLGSNWALYEDTNHSFQTQNQTGLTGSPQSCYSELTVWVSCHKAKPNKAKQASPSERSNNWPGTNQDFPLWC